MHKEQNAISFIVFFIITSCLFAQSNIEGKYSYVDGTGYFFQNYSFDKQDKFEFEDGGDLGISSYGKGHYTIQNDSLILNYDLTKLEYESYFKAKKYYNSNDSININLKITNFKGKALENAMVYTFPIYKATQSDRYGHASLTFKKQKHKDKIKLFVENLFLSKQVIYLDGDSNYNIEVFMNKAKEQFGHPKAIKNQIVKYKIIKITDKLIKLKTKDKIIELVKQVE